MIFATFDRRLAKRDGPYEISGTEGDIEERAITNGLPFRFRRLLMMTDGFIHLRQLTARAAHWVMREQGVDGRTPRLPDRAFGSGAGAGRSGGQGTCRFRDPIALSAFCPCAALASRKNARVLILSAGQHKNVSVTVAPAGG